MTGEVYLNGFAMVPVDRHYGSSPVSLAVDAAKRALEQSGGTVDTIIVASAFSSMLQRQLMLASLIAEELVGKGVQVVNVENGAASGVTAAHVGAGMILSGQAESALVIGVDKLSDYPQSVVNQAYRSTLYYDYHGLMGLSLPVLFALTSRLYLSKYALSEEDLALWPVVMHENAIDVPHAQFRSKITPEAVLLSDCIACPIRVMHAHAQGDGAAAVVLGRRSESSVALLEATHVASGPFEPEPVFDDLTMRPVATAVEAVLRRARVEKKSVGLVEVLDPYSIGGPLVLESAGLVEQGATLRMLREGSFRRGDGLMVNLSGGTKARGHPEGATGVYQLAELACFMTGLSCRPVDAQLGLAISVGGFGAVAAAALVRRV